MNGRPSRYLAVLIYLALAAIPAFYAAMSIVLVITPESPNLGHSTLTLIPAAGVVMAVVLGIAAFLLKRFGLAWSLLATAYLALIALIWAFSLTSVR